MKKFYFFIAIIAISFLVTSCTSADNSFDISIGSDGNGEYPSGDRYTEYGENNFISTSEAPVSTFSVDADGASYANVRRFIDGNYSIPSAAVRVEEFLNYFTFDYPEPIDNENVGLNSEITICPWNKENYLLRLGMKGKTIPLESLNPSNYVFLIDVSGSMSSEDKLDLLKEGFMRLADNLRDNDRVSIVTYSGSVQKLLEPTLGRDREQIKSAIRKLNASGYTDGGSAIKIAYDTALEFYIEGGNNRVILATDGDFNFGITDQDDLVELIESYLDSGVYLTVLGVGRGNLNDSAMEQVANHGNGNYEYIDCLEQLDKVFTNELTKLYTIAKDSKIQVTFNPTRVSKYRLIGYENRKMNEDDFDNDQKDAGEIGVGQTITALYEIIPNRNDTTDATIADFNFRYKRPTEDVSRELKQQISGSYGYIDEVALSENQRFASAVAIFGMLAKKSEFNGNSTKNMVLELAEDATTFDPHGYRSQFINLVRKFNIDTNVQ